MKKYSALDLMLETELRHLYKAEEHNLDQLKILAESATSSELRDLFNHHRTETQHQIERLRQVFGELDIDFKANKLQGLPGITEKGKELLKMMVDMNFTDQSKGMNGILSEAKELLRHFKDTDVNDMALLSAGMKVEHFEIACYKMLCELAEIREEDNVVELLDTSLDEELSMEEKIAEFACSKC